MLVFSWPDYCHNQVMAPKTSKALIDGKLKELRDFVRGNQEMLAARRGTTLANSLRQYHSDVKRKSYMFSHKTGMALTGEQAEHLDNYFALLRDAGNASTAGAPPFSSDGVQSVHLGVPPPEDHVSSGASPSTHARNTGRGRKMSRCQSCQTKCRLNSLGQSSGQCFHGWRATS